MARTQFAGVPDTYVDYYLDQAGFGDGTIFQGHRIQRGYGLGSIFGKLFRFAMPLLKRGAKHAGQALAKTGVNIASDALQGGDIRESSKTHFTNMGKTLASDAAGFLQSQAGKGNKRKRVSGPGHNGTNPRGGKYVSFALARPAAGLKRKRETLLAHKQPRDSRGRFDIFSSA